MPINETPDPSQNTSASELANRINKIIDLIPNNFDGREIVVLSLQSRLDSIAYTPPEAMIDRWNEVSYILYNSLPKTEDCDWAKQISELFKKPY